MQGKSPSEHLDDLRKRRQELVVQLAKSDDMTQPYVQPDSASAISHRVYDRQSTPTSSAHPQPANTVLIDMAKTHMTFSSQLSQASQPQVNQPQASQLQANQPQASQLQASQPQVIQPQTNQPHVNQSQSTPTVELQSGDPQANHPNDRTLHGDSGSAQSGSADPLIGVSVHVTAASPAAVSTVTVTPATSRGQPHFATSFGTTTLNTIVTINVAHAIPTSQPTLTSATLETSALPIERVSSSDVIDGGSRLTSRMSHSLADSMATACAAMTLANLPPAGTCTSA